MSEPCPKTDCWHWVPPGGVADVTGQVYPDIDQAVSEGRFTIFPDGGCSCPGKCSRVYKEGQFDWFEPAGG